jgi:hypothetical protein
MRTTLARLATTSIVVLIVVGCSSTSTTSPSPTGSATTSSAPPIPSASATSSATPSASSTPGPSQAVDPQPSYPLSQAAAFPMRGSAREMGDEVHMVPGPDGSLLVTIPAFNGSTLAILDRGGQPRQGWPITVTGDAGCGQLHPISDGSVRVVCPMVMSDEPTSSAAAVFAFDRNGRLLPGWPIALDGIPGATRMVGDELTIFASWRLVDNDDGKPTEEFGLVTIGYTGEVRNGTRVPMFCCEGSAALGPEGIASAVIDVFGDESTVTSKITAIDASGVSTGWPVAIDGYAATPAIGPDGRIFVAAGWPTKTTSDIFALTRDGQMNAGSTIPIAMVDEALGDTGGCSASPRQPLVADDGTVVVFSEADTTVVALQPSLLPKAGWPYEPARALVMRDERYVKEDAYCPSLAIPAVGPDSSVYLPLEARTSTVGGSLVAVGPNGRVRAGWPVELKRAGSEFWSVVVGPDGTVYALAIEPESSRTSSASILAIAPDSTVRYTATIIEP